MLKHAIPVLIGAIIGLHGCGGSHPGYENWDKVPPNITAITVTEASYEDFEVPDLSPPQRLNVDMDSEIGPRNSGIPDMEDRCHAMGGELIDQTCFNVDY